MLKKIRSLLLITIYTGVIHLAITNGIEGAVAIPTGAVNNSYPTCCAEFDNINIPIYKEGITDYRITVTHPGYAETIAPQPLWTIGIDDGQVTEFKQSGFSDFDEFYPQDGYGLEEFVSECPKEINNDWMNHQYLKFTTQDGTKTDLGAKFTIDFAGVNGTLEIEALTWNGTDWTSHGSKVFNSSNKSQTWEFADGTWVLGTDSNNIHLDVVTAQEDGQSTPGSWAQYDQIRLTRRAILNNREPDWTGCPPPDPDDGGSAPDTFIDLYHKSSNVDVIGAKVDKWWRPGEAMTIKVVGGDTLTNAHYFQLYHKVPDTECDYQQILVLYEDGYARILPLPREGEDWIPFGSSVIIGPAQEAERPHSDIDEVIIDPENLTVDITYGDGSKAHLQLSSDRTQTVVNVDGITYNTTDYPFATFRSMWVEDGNADVDHIYTQDGTYPVMGDWQILDGNWWFFNREIVSKHNTLSPDIMIEVTGCIPEPATFILLGLGFFSVVVMKRRGRCL